MGLLRSWRMAVFNNIVEVGAAVGGHGARGDAVRLRAPIEPQWGPARRRRTMGFGDADGSCCGFEELVELSPASFSHAL